MKDRIRELLEKLDVRRSDINALLDEENDESNVGEIADQVVDAVFDRRKSDMVSFANKKLAQKLNAAFGLGLSRSDAESSDLDDIVDRVKQVSKPEEIDTSELDRLRETIANVQTERDDWKSKYESDIESLKKEYDGRIKKMTVEQQLEREFGRVDWGIAKAHIPVFKDRIKNDILQQYDVADDGSIKSADGGKAYSPDGDKQLSTISDAVDLYVSRYGVQRQSNGRANTGEYEGDPDIANGEQLSDAAKAMRERAFAAAKQQAELRERIS